MWHGAVFAMDHHLAWSDNLFALFNHLSCYWRFACRAETVEVERISYRNQFRVYPKKYDPQFTKHAPDDIADHKQRHAGCHIAPAQRTLDGSVVKLYAGPDGE